MDAIVNQFVSCKIELGVINGMTALGLKPGFKAGMTTGNQILCMLESNYQDGRISAGFYTIETRRVAEKCAEIEDAYRMCTKVRAAYMKAQNKAEKEEAARILCSMSA